MCETWPAETPAINRQTESSIYGGWTPRGLRTVTPHTFRVEEDAEEEWNRGFQAAAGAGQFRQFLIVLRSTDATMLNHLLAHKSFLGRLWIFFFYPFDCIREQLACAGRFHMQVITCARSRQRATVSRPFEGFKVSASLLPHLSAKDDPAPCHVHIVGGRKSNTLIISHCAKVVSLVSTRGDGQKSAQLKLEQISGKDARRIMSPFQARGASLHHKLNRNDTWICEFN